MSHPHSIEKETNICSKCGDSTTDLFYVHPIYLCKDCNGEMIDEICERYEKEQFEQDIIDSIIY